MKFSRANSCCSYVVTHIPLTGRVSTRAIWLTDGKPPTGPAVKPAAPAPKPGIAVQVFSPLIWECDQDPIESWSFRPPDDSVSSNVFVAFVSSELLWLPFYKGPASLQVKLEGVQKGQQQPKPVFWSNVGQRSELQYAQAGRGRPLLPGGPGSGGFGGSRHQAFIEHEFAPSGRRYHDEPHPESRWQDPSAQPHWKSPVLPEPAPSAGFGLLDPPSPEPREPRPYGLSSPQKISKAQLDLALEISKLSQHLSRPEFSKELSQQLSHHISQELSRQRQMASDRRGREDFMRDEFPLPRSERMPLLGDVLPLLEKRPLLHDQPPLLPDKGPLLRDSYEDHAPRRPPLLGDSRPGFDDREQAYHFDRRDERRPGLDSYGERRSHDYSDDYGKAYARDLPPRKPADYRRSDRSSSGGLLGKPPLLGSRF
ncbi:hypothetical protein HPB51_002506 [Rhipicephalus microplus]|uniref:Uncharacterized protein n=1 Tax=Rhipicephalus microplus TaxID=6941 RepID=A0A9J6DEL9_RHIMP|nr:hypothetical protein HPB51_002506 [Rhipicephalus microplus]